MPPEPLPWDRKDLFRKRKHERSEPLGSLNRWRDHHGSRELGRCVSTDFRRHPGHGKQGGWHLFPEEFEHGYFSWRSNEKMLEDESFRPVSRTEGKNGRQSRDTRGSYSQRDWKGHYCENSNGPSNSLARSRDVNNEQRSRDDIASYSSRSKTGLGNTWKRLQLNEQHDKIGGCKGFGTSQKSERETCLGFNDLKPLKWTRSGSLSSLGSGFSHSSHSRSIGAADSNEAKAESQINKGISVRSPSGDATACVTSAAPSEYSTFRKKPRIGWGEGLAKYEKKKVDVPDFSLNKDGAVFVASDTEPVCSLGSNLVDKSPRLMHVTDFASPANPSSIACSSSPGVEKSVGSTVNVENNISDLCGLLGPLSQNHLEGSPFNLEKLGSNLIAEVGSSLTELLQTDEQCSVESSYVRSTVMNKLLIRKGDFSKALEVTESEIDYLENELKSLDSGAFGSSRFPVTYSSVPAVNDKPSEDWGFVTNSIPRPAPLHVDASGGTISETVSVCDQGDICSNAKDEDVDSPVTVTSKLVEPHSLMKVDSSYDILNNRAAAGNLDPIQVIDRDDKCSAPVYKGENTGLSYFDGILQTYGENFANPFFGLCKYGEEILVKKILESNKETANEAYEVFNKSLPQHQCKVDFSGDSDASSSQNVSLIKERFAMRKRFLKFKEREMTLKFKAFQQLWKEDMRLLSIKKYRAKSHKFEPSLHIVQSGYQKHRSSIRTRFSSFAGDPSLIPTAEIINCARKLRLSSEVEVYRNNLKMPTMILDEKEKTISRFISCNGLVEDPCAVEKERDMINPWIQGEKDIFMDKFSTFGKDFRKIASFLDHKTTADCVDFYYKNHKSESFKKMKKLDSKQGKTSSNTYFMTSGKRWNSEMNVASLDILGMASIMAARSDSRVRSHQAYSRRVFLGGCSASKTSWDDGNAERPCISNILRYEKETATADVLAGICGSLSSEAMSSCITSSVDPGEGWKCQKVDDSVTKQPWTPIVRVNVDNEICSDESCGEMNPTDWTDQEKSSFVQAVSSFGRDFVMISRCVRTRSRDQCRVFFSKARKCLGLDSLRPGTINGRTFVADDANEGGSDSEDGCLLELEAASGMRSSKPGSKMDEDLALSITTMNNAESDQTGPMSMQTAHSRSDEINGEEQIDNKDVGNLDSLASDACHREDRAKLVSDGDSNIMNVAKQSQSLPTQKSESTFVNEDAGTDNTAEISVAESASFFEGNESNVLYPEPCVGMEPVDEASSDVVGNKLEQDGKQNANTIGQCSFQLMPHDSNSTGSSCLATDRCSSFNLKPEYEHQVSFALNSMGKPSVLLLSQETSLAVTNCTLGSPSIIQCEKVPAEDKLSSILDIQHRDKSDNPVHRDETHKPLVGPPLGESVQVLRGHPLQMPIKKEIKEDISCRSLSDVQSLPKSERNVNGQFATQNCSLHKCNSSKPEPSLINIPLMSQKMEQAFDPPKCHLQSLSDSEKPSRNGGQIVCSDTQQFLVSTKGKFQHP